MTRRLILGVHGVAALFLVALALMRSPVAGAGALLGLVGTAASLFGTWAAVNWVGRVMRDDAPKWHGAAVPIAFMVIKLPVVLGAMSWALRLGPPAPAWFLAGLALVYSGLVWWAVATT